MPGRSHEPGLGLVSVHLVSASLRQPPPHMEHVEAHSPMPWAGPGIRGQDDAGLARWLPSDHVDLGQRHMALETLLGVPVWAGTHLIFHLGLWSQRKYMSRQSRGQGILPAKSPAALAPALTSS